MSASNGDLVHVEPVQAHFATVLAWFVRVALAVLFVTFALYATGIVPSAVGIERVPSLWHLSAGEYAQAAGHPLGWGWIADLAQGRVISFAALVLFPTGTLLLVLLTGWFYLKEGVRAYAGIALAEALVLLVAATGVL